MLWRVRRHRFDETPKVDLDVGHALVTPAWQRVERDVFGDLPWRRKGESDSSGDDAEAAVAD